VHIYAITPNKIQLRKSKKSPNYLQSARFCKYGFLEISLAFFGAPQNLLLIFKGQNHFLEFLNRRETGLSEKTLLTSA
jgi:hypothetical protein